MTVFQKLDESIYSQIGSAISSYVEPKCSTFFEQGSFYISGGRRQDVKFCLGVLAQS